MSGSGANKLYFTKYKSEKEPQIIIAFSKRRRKEAATAYKPLFVSKLGFTRC